MKALIVDDEAKARRILENLLTTHCPDVEIVGMADDVPSAVKAVHQHKPDLLFLDIEMPGYTGFQLIDFFDKIEFDIIFTTAYSEYALKAFEVSAIDYLLKPIQIEQLIHAVERASLKNDAFKLEKMEALRQNLQTGGQVAKIALPVSDGLLFVKPDEIEYLKAESSYTSIYLTNGKSLLVSKTLKEFEKLITNPQFMRVHRSYFVNLNHVRQYVRTEGGHLEMDNGDIVYFSKDKRDELLDAFQAMND
ncbi:MAG: response regulator transcription factor [Bacteroidetes bacterium]|nr:response regulator transcription factor [Bacteroidota bacterium]